MSDDGPEPPPDSGDPGDGDKSGEPPPANAPLPADGGNAGEALFQNNLGTIEKALRFVCRRHGLSLDEAEDFASHARLKLMENGYAVSASFRVGASSKPFWSRPSDMRCSTIASPSGGGGGRRRKRSDSAHPRR